MLAGLILVRICGLCGLLSLREYLYVGWADISENLWVMLLK